jgi:hypothetical protein
MQMLDKIYQKYLALRSYCFFISARNRGSFYNYLYLERNRVRLQDAAYRATAIEIIYQESIHLKKQRLSIKIKLRQTQDQIIKIYLRRLLNQHDQAISHFKNLHKQIKINQLSPPSYTLDTLANPKWLFKLIKNKYFRQCFELSLLACMALPFTAYLYTLGYHYWQTVILLTITSIGYYLLRPMFLWLYLSVFYISE